MAGIRLTDKDKSATVHQIVGIRTSPTKKVTPIDFDDFAEQLLAGKVGDAIEVTASQRNFVDPVVVMATDPVDIATGLANGSVVDGETLVTGQRVALGGQGAQNGLYLVPASGAASRTADANTAAEFINLEFYVQKGARAGMSFRCTNSGPITLGVTPITFGESSNQAALLPILAEKAEQVDVDAINDRPLPRDVFHPEYAAILSAGVDGTIEAAIRHDGSHFPTESPGDRRWMPRVQGSAPNRRIEVERDDGLTLTIAGDFEGDAYAPAIVGTKCRYLIKRGNVTEIQFQELAPTTTLSPSVTTLNHAPIHGQSLAIAGYSGTILNNWPTRPGKVMMFKAGGIRTLDLSHAPTYINRRQDVALLDHLADAAERSHGDNGETGWARFGAACFTGTNPLGNSDGLLVSTHGIGGSSYNSLKKGTVPYINLLVAVRRAYNLARILGLTYRIPAVIWVQGEANVGSGTSAATYKAYLEELQANLDADIKAITGLTEDVKLIIDVIASWTVYGLATSEVALGQLMAANDNPTKIICIGTKQVREYAPDGLHLLSLGYARSGEMFAHFWRNARAGVFLTALQATSAVRSGLTITLSTTGGVGNLALDTLLSAARTNSGFVLSQVGGTATAIASVAPSGSNVLIGLTVDPGAGVLTLSGGLVGTPNAKPQTATAPGINIRDNLNLASEHGASQHKWLSPFELAVA